jgi:phospholipase/carboxylesterase
VRVQEGHYGGLDCLVVRSESRAPRLACILCHGFGAGGDDLLGLAEPLLQMVGERREDLALVFPAAVLSLAEQGFGMGRAWWWIDLDRLLNNPTPETLHAFRCVRPEGMSTASDHLQRAVLEIQQEWNLAPDQIALGGFSQGSMIATDAAMLLPTPPAALIIYSGALICESEWTAGAAKLTKTKIIQSHGRRDPILHVSQGQALKDALTAGGCTVKYLEFAGMHEIHPAAISATADLLRNLLTSHV